MDADSPQILYEIVNGNTLDGAFSLHPRAGSLSLRRRLQKSDGGQFNLTVVASDGSLNDTALIVVTLLVSISSSFNTYVIIY